MILQSLFLLEILIRSGRIRRNSINQILLDRNLVKIISKSASLEFNQNATVDVTCLVHPGVEAFG